MNSETLTTNLLTISAEVVLILLFFVVLNWIVGRAIRSVSATAAFRRFEPGALVLRRNLRLMTALVALLVLLGVVGANLYLVYRGENLLLYTRGLLEDVPRSTWVDLGIAAAQIVALTIVTAVLLRLIRKALSYTRDRAQAFEGIKANDESIERLFVALKRLIGRGVWLLVGVTATRLLGLPAAVPDTLFVALKIYLIVALGLLCWRAVDAVIVSVEALSKKYAGEMNLLRVYDRLEPLVPVLRRSIESVIYVTVATLVVLQVELIAPLAEWGPRAIRIIGVVFLGRVAGELAKLLIEETLITRAQLTSEQKQRRETLIPLLQSLLRYAIYFCVAVVVLKELGINPTPILAGAGIVGLAVGLGAQNLINDVVSGFFILFEEHYYVGDFVKAAEAEGIVESIDLRTTRIRDNSGRHHILRNGQIGDLVNYSKTYTNAVVEVGVAYESDLDHVVEVLNRVGEQLRQSHDDVLASPIVKGLDAFGESDLVMRTVTRVKPGRHLQVERAFRKLIKEAFDKESIEIPYARRVLILETPEPFAEMASATGSI